MPYTFPEALMLVGTGSASFALTIYVARMLGQGIGWLLTFITGRQDKREADADAATASAMQLLHDELIRVTGRLSVVERDLEECKQHRDDIAKERNEIARERAELRGFLNGEGRARQLAALLIAEDKLASGGTEG